MDSTEELASAKQAIISFAKAWTAWETKMAETKNSIHDPILKKAHTQLMLDHCTAKKRAYVDGLPTYGIPPTYGDVLEDNIINTDVVNPRKVVVDFLCLRQYYRFTVIKKQDAWLIDTIKWKVIETDNWRNGLIGM